MPDTMTAERARNAPSLDTILEILLDEIKSGDSSQRRVVLDRLLVVFGEAHKIDATKLRDRTEELTIRPYANGKTLPELWETRPELANEDQAQAAAETAKICADLGKRFDDLKAQHKRPLDKAGTLMLRATELWMKGVSDLETALRGKINAWQRKELDRQRAEKAKAEEAAKQLQAEGRTEEAAQQLAQQPKGASIKTDYGTRASASVKWKAEVIPGQENQVRRELCSPDQKKIDALIALHKAQGTIASLVEPGLRIFEDVQTSIG